MSSSSPHARAPHDHAFGQDRKRPGESRTWIVMVITATMMAVEISAGILFGSMALLADGLHMGSHAAALSIAAFAYWFTRRHAHNRRFSFGTGKVNALGGFSSAILLALFALMMVWESVHRLLSPVEIAFNQAILVAVLGLVVNAASLLILGHDHHHHDHHHHDHHHHDHHHHDHHHHDRHDHNLRAAYFHVLADALTSLLAIFALLTAKYFAWIWMDPLMGIVGAFLVARWSVGLLTMTASVLLDRQAPEEWLEAARHSIEGHDQNRITDLHIWSIGPGIQAAALVLTTPHPKPPDHYKSLLPRELGVVHLTVEVHRAGEPDHGSESF